MGGCRHPGVVARDSNDKPVTPITIKNVKISRK